MTYTPIEVHEAKTKLDAGWDPFVLDVRRPDETALGALPFCDRTQPHVRIHEILDELPKDRDILVYCKKGGRSAWACQRLAAEGFEQLHNLEGGITAWAHEIDPSIKVG